MEKVTVVELFEKEKELLRAQFDAEIAAIKREAEKGAIGNANWLEERIGMSFSLIRERILYPYRKELEGEIVYYPETQGKPWRINKYAFNNWLSTNFSKIQWG